MRGSMIRAGKADASAGLVNLIDFGAIPGLLPANLLKGYLIVANRTHELRIEFKVNPSPHIRVDNVLMASTSAFLSADSAFTTRDTPSSQLGGSGRASSGTPARGSVTPNSQRLQKRASSMAAINVERVHTVDPMQASSDRDKLLVLFSCAPARLGLFQETLEVQTLSQTLATSKQRVYVRVFLDPDLLEVHLPVQSASGYAVLDLGHVFVCSRRRRPAGAVTAGHRSLTRQHSEALQASPGMRSAHSLIHASPSLRRPSDPPAPPALPDLTFDLLPAPARGSLLMPPADPRDSEAKKAHARDGTVASSTVRSLSLRAGDRSPRLSATPADSPSVTDRKTPSSSTWLSKNWLPAPAGFLSPESAHTGRQAVPSNEQRLSWEHPSPLLAARFAGLSAESGLHDLTRLQVIRYWQDMFASLPQSSRVSLMSPVATMSSFLVRNKSRQPVRVQAEGNYC